MYLKETVHVTCPNDVLCFSDHFQFCFKLNQDFRMQNLKDVFVKILHRIAFSKDKID